MNGYVYEDLPEITQGEINRTALEMVCQMSNIPVNTQTMHRDWVLLTYDLPNTAEGRKIRNEFLQKAKMLGAVMHTESSYIMPNTGQANAIITKMASVDAANICVFYSKVEDEMWVSKLTDKYAVYLASRIKKLENRVERAEDHVAEGKFGVARRMSKKNWEFVDGLTVSAAGYGHEKTASDLLGLINRLKVVEHSCDYEETKNDRIAGL